MSRSTSRIASRALRKSCWYPLRSPPSAIETSTASRNGPYERACVLRRVGEDRDLVEAGVVERTADHADLAVHHPARRDHVRPRRRLGDRGIRIDLQRRIVVDHAMLVDDPAVAVVGVLVDTQVGHQHDGVAELGPQVARVPPGRCRRDRRRRCRSHPSRRARRTGSPPSRRGRSGRPPRHAAIRRCAGRRPGSDSIGCGSLMPSRTNSGATRSSTRTCTSATRSRSAAVRRRRRGRTVGRSGWSPFTRPAYEWGHDTTPARSARTSCTAC